MSWDEQIFGLLDELEQQAEELFGLERAIELSDRARAEYAQVTLASRLAASVELPVVLRVLGVGQVRGELRRTGDGWCLLSAHGHEWVVRAAAIAEVHGASPRSFPEAAWQAVHRLGTGSVLRRIADAGETCVVHLVDGHRHEGRLTRVGADFVELAVGEERDARAVLLALPAIGAIQSPRID